MKYKWFFAVLIALCLVLVIYSSYTSFRYESVQAMNREENAKLLDTVARLKESLAATQSRIGVVEEAMDQYSGLSETLRTLLISKGHEDPEGFILTILKDKEDLIRSTPVLGGTFFFTKIVILRDNLAFAEFEDGHISGYLLMSFEYDAYGDQIEVSHVFEFLE